jgi:hypothetical protein
VPVCCPFFASVDMFRSYRGTVRLLRKHFSQTRQYDTLGKTSLARWFTVHGVLTPLGLKLIEDSKKRYVSLPHASRGGGRPSYVAPSTRNVISKTLQGMRLADVSLNSFLAQGLIRGIMMKWQPEMLDVNDGPFKVSRSWVRAFMNKEMGWTFRAGTQAARKKPATWEKDIRDMLTRAALLVRLQKVPPQLFINFDQTGLHLVPLGNEKTYEAKGKIQVGIAGLNEKAQITAVVTSTAAGNMLPVQLIFTGLSERSLPSASASADARMEGFDITNTKNHWSSLETMKRYIKNIIDPYVKKTRTEMKLPDDQKVVLLMDCWSVHRSKEFRGFLSDHYKNYFILFVPAGCTGTLFYDKTCYVMFMSCRVLFYVLLY